MEYDYFHFLFHSSEKKTSETNKASRRIVKIFVQQYSLPLLFYSSFHLTLKHENRTVLVDSMQCKYICHESRNRTDHSTTQNFFPTSFIHYSELFQGQDEHLPERKNDVNINITLKHMRLLGN